MSEDLLNRRQAIQIAAIVGGGLIISGCATAADHAQNKKQPEEDVSPAEDLMREHGVLKRILLVYAEAIRRIDANEDSPPEPVVDAAQIIRSFVEDYHEKLEENFLFPRFRKHNTLVDLVDVLTQQHQAGRRVTDITLRYANIAGLRDADRKRQLADSMRQSSACTTRTKRVRTRCYFRHSARPFRRTNTTPSVRTLRRRSTSCLGRTDLR